MLKEAIRNGYSDYNHMEEDNDFEAIRSLPAFGEIIKAGRLDRRYAAVWSGDTGFETVPVFGLEPAAHEAQCRKLIGQGFRPVSISVTRAVPKGPLVTSSVWHRPVVSEEVKDELAMRQARAAIALIRLGKADPIWRLLRHSADPRLRSYMINWLRPLGAEPGLIAAELNRIGPAAGATPARTSQKMDDILFHPDTSMRRALILALGTYGAEELSFREREPLLATLLDVYENDPDSGIHGAAGWALRKWGQHAKLAEADTRLARLGDVEGTRWYLNTQGQTLVKIEGPTEFQMGSPPWETRVMSRNETLHRRVIPRNFAIADTEVTIEQYQSFVKENPDHQLLFFRSSPDRSGTRNGTSWFDAAAYCNWLSRKEGLEECYEPKARKEYAKGMTLRADALRRSGYRLPTEAEWEYACRAGAVTPRYYGASVDLLEAYAWYGQSSSDHTWRAGSLLPNDLGLFDMLGNVCEWCQEGPHQNDSGNSTKVIYDDYNGLVLSVIDVGVVRGGAFSDRPLSLRSAYFRQSDMTIHDGTNGVRLARTYP